MFEFTASVLALLLLHPSHSGAQTPEEAAEQLAELIKPVPADKIDAIRQVCDLPAEAKFIDARHIASADELATMLEGLELDTEDAPRTIVHGGKFVGEEITVMLEKMHGGCIHESDLSRTQAPGGEFRYGSIINSSLEGADWSGMEMDETRLIGVNAKDANFAGANLRGGLWVGQNWNSDLSKADFSNTLMLGFRFECGITMDESCGGSSGAKFDRADLSAADLAEFPTWGYDSFDGAVFEGTRIHPRAIKNLKGMELGSSIFLASAGKRWDKEAGNQGSVPISPSEFELLRADNLAAVPDAPSFDCAKSSNFAEDQICDKYGQELRALDRDMALAFALYNMNRRVSLRSQRDWLNSRNACQDRSCIVEAYQSRISVLLAALDTRLNLAPDQSVAFHEDVLPLSQTMRKTELYKRILPVLEGASMQDVTLTGLEGGSIRIKGTAVGGNAHLCGVEADAFYDAKTGWYSARSLVNDKPVIVPLFRVWEDRLQFKYSGNMGDTPREAGSFISCGARAAFGELRALNGI